MSRNRRPAPFTAPSGKPAAAAPPVAEPEKPELLAVRMLTVEHVGRWIQINAVPITLNDKTHPSVNVQVGRLVGIRKGEYSTAPAYAIDPKRRLVIQQGSAIAELLLGVDHPVEVAPRAWS